MSRKSHRISAFMVFPPSQIFPMYWKIAGSFSGFIKEAILFVIIGTTAKQYILKVDSALKLSPTYPTVKIGVFMYQSSTITDHCRTLVRS